MRARTCRGELLRPWTWLSPPGLHSASDHGSAAPSISAPQVPGAEPKADPPTTGDRWLHAIMGRFTVGVSPVSLGLAYADWAFHLAASPGKCHLLLENRRKPTTSRHGARSTRSTWTRAGSAIT
jgi:polyhydroxyalkanoate synthase subunit PhaC